MIEYKNVRAASVIGPFGGILTVDSLPPARTTRWVARRKAEVVCAVEGGLLTIDEALDRYDLSMEEFVSWRRAMEREGIPGLRASSAQHYRDMRNGSQPQSHLRILPAQFGRKAPATETEESLAEAVIGFAIAH